VLIRPNFFISNLTGSYYPNSQPGHERAEDAGDDR
jgi:hypothetical protein